MVEPISTGAALVGAGTWFANKLLGPGADALGEQLKVFSSARLGKIFRRAEDIGSDISLEPLPPGFAYLALQKASFSEDDDALTDMWANLLINASKSFSSRHATFADILSQIGPMDANILNNLIPIDFKYKIIGNMRASMTVKISEIMDWMIVTSQEEANSRAIGLFSSDFVKMFNFPGRFSLVTCPFRTESDDLSGVTVCNPLTTSDDILIRQRLLEKFEFDLMDVGRSPYVEGVLVTSLALHFLNACRGAEA